MFGAYNVKRLGLIITALLVAALLGGCSGNDKDKNEAKAPKPSQEQLQKADLLNRTADDMYQKLLQGEVEDSRIVLQQLTDQISQIRYEGLTSAEGMTALTQTVTDAQRIFGLAKVQPEDRQIAAAKVRLAADALTHPTQPLWLQYYDRLQDDVTGVEQAAKSQRQSDLQSASSRLEHNYSIVQPSLVIGRMPSDVEKMDSLVTFVRSQSLLQGEPFDDVLNAVPAMRQMLDKLFMRQATTAYLPYPEPQNPILWTLTFGLIILSSLAFAGWRLSKKNDGLVPVRRSNDDTR